MAVNAPAVGTIKEFLVNEEDTVTVGQDLLKLELGDKEKGEGQQIGKQESKAPATDDKTTTSQPQPEKKMTSPSQDASPDSSSSSSKEGSQPHVQEPNQSTAGKEPSAREKIDHNMSGSKKLEPKSSSNSPYGSREEKRVGQHPDTKSLDH